MEAAPIPPDLMIRERLHVREISQRYGVPTQVLQERLRRQGISRIWELKEYGPEFEEAVELFDPVYDGAEGYWCSQRLDWIVYASHERSITVGGSLVATIHDVRPRCSKHPWKPWRA